MKPLSFGSHDEQLKTHIASECGCACEPVLAKVCTQNTLTPSQHKRQPREYSQPKQRVDLREDSANVSASGEGDHIETMDLHSTRWCCDDEEI